MKGGQGEKGGARGEGRWGVGREGGRDSEREGGRDGGRCKRVRSETGEESRNGDKGTKITTASYMKIVDSTDSTHTCT